MGIFSEVIFTEDALYLPRVVCAVFGFARDHQGTALDLS